MLEGSHKEMNNKTVCACVNSVIVNKYFFEYSSKNLIIYV